MTVAKTGSQVYELKRLPSNCLKASLITEHDICIETASVFANEDSYLHHTNKACIIITRILACVHMMNGDRAETSMIYSSSTPNSQMLNIETQCPSYVKEKQH